MKRIALFLMTNFAVLVLLSLVMSVLQSVFGISFHGNMMGMLVFAAIFGMGGAFISLMMSKFVAKRSTGAQVITNPSNETERWLINVVQRQADACGIKMPEVAIYPAPEINAFATGARKNASLVAVSTGLLENMTAEEAEAVLAHEVSHVANGDMVTMALLQGVMNTFVIFLARVIGMLVDAWLSGDDDDGSMGIGYYVTAFVLDMVFGVLASIIVSWYSRRREFRADAGSAHMVGKQKMIAALERLGSTYGENTLPKGVKAFGISGGLGQGIKKLFASHPPLAERIAYLRENG